MSNLWLNIRFGSTHLQCQYGRLPKLINNYLHSKASPNRQEPDWKWLRVYELRSPIR